jgi:hypothetical protein
VHRTSTVGGAGSSTLQDGADKRWKGPKQLLGFARWAARSEVRRALGVSFEERGLLGAAQLDSFGDVVPPKTLNAQRDGAIGWIRREGEQDPGRRGRACGYVPTRTGGRTATAAALSAACCGGW